MPFKRNAWTPTETILLTENYDLPIQELLDMFPRHSQPSIEQKMNKLRKEGRIGYKSEETVKKAYLQRKRHG